MTRYSTQIVAFCCFSLVASSAQSGVIQVGLLLPAIQKVREAASRLQSGSNMRRVGIGVHDYHDLSVQRTDASGNLLSPEVTGWSSGLSYSAHLLPFDEHAGFGEVKSEWSIKQTSRQKITVTGKVYIGPSATNDWTRVKMWSTIPYRVIQKNPSSTDPTLRWRAREHATTMFGSGPSEITRWSRNWAYASALQRYDVFHERYGAGILGPTRADGFADWGGRWRPTVRGSSLDSSVVDSALMLRIEQLNALNRMYWTSGFTMTNAPGSTIDGWNTFEYSISIDDANFELELLQPTATVPEPSSLAICGIGILLLAGVRRRKRVA